MQVKGAQVAESKIESIGFIEQNAETLSLRRLNQAKEGGARSRLELFAISKGAMLT